LALFRGDAGVAWLLITLVNRPSKEARRQRAFPTAFDQVLPTDFNAINMERDRADVSGLPRG
jgi:hypothetical protein